MDKDTREHLAALVGRLHRLAEQAEDSADIDAAADAIEDLVAAIDRLTTYIEVQSVSVQPIAVTHTIGED